MKIIEKIINAFLMSRNHAVKVSNVICLTGCDGKFTGIRCDAVDWPLYFHTLFIT